MKAYIFLPVADILTAGRRNDETHLAVRGCFASFCLLAQPRSPVLPSAKRRQKRHAADDGRPKIDADRDLYNNFDDPEKTRQNPNFISLTEGSENQRADTRKAMQLIERHTDYRPVSVWFHGGNMYVTVDVPDELSAAERRREASRIDKLLTKAIPTYEIVVRLN
ncbi:hypothetical protein [Geobacillus stearothermophilus]|uniref:hypothetical protein n=1 Tax=Geobacillus stearothermophilus TaxID=1422 RepID=UPI002E20F381|nr:hypothetical protein [Geobacillus stearothermophilus]MED4869883.1 hypothetical protein [Geobacillus stearothermophilus]MED4987345.1 hypothetical protein [Geobacillus stearothermophilus]